MYVHAYLCVFMYENAGTQEPQRVEVEDNLGCQSYTMSVTVSLLFSPS